MGEYQRALRARLRGTKQAQAQPVTLLGTRRSEPSAPKADFLGSRRMFAVVGDEVRVAGPGAPRFHREWLKDLDDRAFNRIVRGYYLAPDIVFYRGRFDVVPMREIRMHLPRLKALLELPEDTQVHSGARPTNGDDMVGEHHLGPLPWMIDEEPANDLAGDDGWTR